MKQVFSLIGAVLFWGLWPFWFIYFKFAPVRSRILVVYEREVLLIRGWVSSGRWSLPGGGVSKKESISEGAIRELNEEVSILVPESALRPLGEYSHSAYGLRYKAIYFALELPEKIEPKIRWPEVIDASWHKLSDIRGRMLDEDAAFALKKYVPHDQTELL